MSAMDERTAIRSRTRAALWRLAGPWWIFLLTGIAWLIISWVVLRFTPPRSPRWASFWACCFWSPCSTNS